MSEKEVLDIFIKNNALLQGHFKLSSGLHSRQYLQCALVLQYPDIAEKMAIAVKEKFADAKPDFVIGPALGGVTFAYEVARAFGVRGIFTERENGVMTLRRGFSIKPGERAIVIEDVITTGGSTKEVIEVVKRAEGKVIGVSSIIDRSMGGANLGVTQASLASIKVETFDPENCPLCKAHEPLTKPGSRG